MHPVALVNDVIFGNAAVLGSVSVAVLFLRRMLSLDCGLDRSLVRSGLPLRELRRYVLPPSMVAALAAVVSWAQLLVKRWRWFAEYALPLVIFAVLTGVFSGAGRHHHDLVSLWTRTRSTCFVGACGEFRAFSPSWPVLEPRLALLASRQHRYASAAKFLHIFPEPLPTSTSTGSMHNVQGVLYSPSSF